MYKKYFINDGASFHIVNLKPERLRIKIIPVFCDIKIEFINLAEKPKEF
jgi:hypothetical protein